MNTGSIQFSSIFVVGIFLSNVGEILSEFRGKPQRMTKSVEILLKFHELIRKIAEIVGLSEIIQFSD